MTRARASEQPPAKPPLDKEGQSPPPSTPERKGPALIALPKRTAGPDTAYRALLGHTTTCTTCRVGASCPMAVRLGRVWREARRG